MGVVDGRTEHPNVGTPQGGVNLLHVVMYSASRFRDDKALVSGRAILDVHLYGIETGRLGTALARPFQQGLDESGGVALLPRTAADCYYFHIDPPLLDLQVPPARLLRSRDHSPSAAPATNSFSPTAVPHGEIGELSTRCLPTHRDVGNACPAGTLSQRRRELLQQFAIALCHDLDLPAREIPHTAGDAQCQRTALRERPEAHHLHVARDDGTESCRSGELIRRQMPFLLLPRGRACKTHSLRRTFGSARTATICPKKKRW